MSFHGQITDPADAHRTAAPARTLPVYDARRLTDGDGTATIVLDDKAYQLRITRAGKLILTK
ncbi:hemin uptake protein HemP [Roseicyclus mahoneyensis]|jgi:hemin uptake protein HemP|uniref:Hemin uptake protein HemP n=1 Tax=Roseicyclus mahoneyensis TaxID=164332 RepID=A0A316GG21_9RHOB|nr:hemin uptake protein HemP [Roseicyclus mahoneyensis]PWK59585.1 hemin uptake protein HemP [Roseicyclus mahoneyensis]